MPGTDRSYPTMALWRVFRPYLLPHRARIAGAVVSLLMVAGALLTMGRGLAYLVDEGLGRQDPALLDRAVVGTAAIALFSPPEAIFARRLSTRSANAFSPISARRCSRIC